MENFLRKFEISNILYNDSMTRDLYTAGLFAFAFVGKGTAAPFDPPRRLVAQGWGWAPPARVPGRG